MARSSNGIQSATPDPPADPADEEELARLMAVYRPYLLALANQAMNPELRAKGGASDLVQETFLEAHQGLARYRGDSPQELVAWLRQILLHNIANFRRRYAGCIKRAASRERPLSAVTEDDVATDSRPEREVLTAEQTHQLEQALDRLTPDYREIVVLRSFEQLPFREIAERRKVTEAAAQKCWARAILVLREILADERS